MKVIALVVVLALSGCSVLFQERLPSDYTGRTEPRCSTVHGWYLWDAAMAAGEIVFAAAIAEENDERGQVIIPAAAHIVSAIYGLKWRAECVVAIDERDAHDQQPQQVTIIRDQASRAKPSRGFFCAVSARGSSVCRREQLECERARDTLVVSTPDVGECAAAANAWCTGADGENQRCYADQKACESSGTGDAESPCRERH